VLPTPKDVGVVPTKTDPLKTVTDVTKDPERKRKRKTSG
jgi:hypothetical protein